MYTRSEIIESTDAEIMEAYETHRRNGNGEPAGRETDTPSAAARREGWTILREIPAHHNPGKYHVLAQHPVAGTLWVVCDVNGPWAIEVA